MAAVDQSKSDRRMGVVEYLNYQQRPSIHGLFRRATDWRRFQWGGPAESDSQGTSFHSQKGAGRLLWTRRKQCQHLLNSYKPNWRQRTESGVLRISWERYLSRARVL